jgi:hypothetical protein
VELLLYGYEIWLRRLLNSICLSLLAREQQRR